jgi:hypothetical protein
MVRFVVASMLCWVVGCPTELVLDLPRTGEGEGELVADGEGELVAEGEGEGEAIAAGEGEGEAVAGEGEGEPVGDPFEPDRVIEVAIEMDADEWRALTLESRSVVDILKPGCLDQPFPSPFRDHPGSVTVDGERFENVFVRKKGLLGSLSRIQPSFKIDLDDVIAQQWRGLDKLVFNNAPQDPSHLHTCLAYHTLRSVGVPAPRCGFAHVVVNGEDKGIYIHVEQVKKQLLRRWFGNDDGALYEGTLSDFSPEWTRTFDKETQLDVPGQPEIDAITAALQVGDDQLLAALDPVVDLPAFYRYWAAEVLVGHWDGYSGNQNNFFVYNDSATGKAHFIAWGADATMGPSIITPLVSVQAASFLPRRLYALPDGRAAYQEQLRDVLNAGWNETDLLIELERLNTLIGPYLFESQRTDQAAATQAIRDYIGARRAEIEAELSSSPEWTAGFRTELCLSPAGQVNVAFNTTFGTWPTDNTFLTGTGTFAATVTGTSFQHAINENGGPFVGAAAGIDTNVPSGEQALMLGAVLDVSGRVLVPLIIVRTEDLQPNVLPIDDVRSQLLLYEIVDGQSFNIGRAYQGTLTITAGGSGTGAPVMMQASADILQLGY